MARWNHDSDVYQNVEEIARSQDLLWDGQYGSPYDLGEMVDPSVAHAARDRRYQSLFDHTKRFKPRGPGRRRSVMAISSPYVDHTPALESLVDEFCDVTGLAALIGDERFRIYKVEATLTLVFWRPDLHRLVHL